MGRDRTFSVQSGLRPLWRVQLFQQTSSMIWSVSPVFTCSPCTDVSDRDGNKPATQKTPLRQPPDSGYLYRKGDSLWISSNYNLYRMIIRTVQFHRASFTRICSSLTFRSGQPTISGASTKVRATARSR